MSGMVWWEIETAEPERFQQFHAALSGWVFVPAFQDTELDADYWLIQQEGRIWPWRILKRPLTGWSTSVARWNALALRSAETIGGSGCSGTWSGSPSACGPST